MRQFKIVLGSSIIAVSTVVASFMIGLLLGSWLIGKKFKNNPSFNELKFYGILEIAIGLYGLLLLKLLPSTLVVFSMFSDPDASFSLLQILLKALFTILLLIVPTAAMGATLPLMVNHFSRMSESFRQTTGHFYGINAMGGAFAAFISGFILIKYLGVSTSILVAVILNVVIGLIAFFISSKTKLVKEEEKELGERISKVKKLNVLLITAFLTGFIAISYEMVWIRCLNYLINNSTYTFSLILFVFLIGIAIGSFLNSSIQKIKDKKLFFALIQFSMVVLSLIIIYLFYDIAYSEAFREIFIERPDKTAAWYENIGLNFYFSLMVFLLPAILMGVSFPLLSDLYYSEGGFNSGYAISRVYVLNTWGSVAGALIPVFLLIPLLAGLKNTMYFLVALNLVIALYFVYDSKYSRKKVLIPSLVALVLLIGWSTKSGNVLASLEGLNDDNINDEIYYYEEGTMATVKVYDRKGSKSLSIDGVTIASEAYKAKESAIAHFPFLTPTKIKDVLVVGLASGSTLRSTLLHKEVNSIDVVEIVPSVVDAVSYFDDSGNDVLANQKVNLYIDDIISFLNYTDKKYDLISSDGKFGPLNKANTTMLSKDYYDLCKERLKDDGIFIQWITTKIPNKHFTTILNTTREVFPFTEMFLNRNNLFLISSKKQVACEYEKVVGAYRDPEIRNDFYSMALYSPSAVLSTYIGINKGNTEVETVNSFNNPVIEYDYEKERSKDMEVSNTSEFRNLLQLHKHYLGNERELKNEYNTILRNDSIISYNSNLSFIESRIAYIRGHFMLYDKNYKKAMEYFNAVVDLNHPDNENDIAVSAKYLGEYHLQSNALEQSIYYLDKAIEKLDGYSAAYTLRGIAHQKKGDSLRGIQDLRKALELDPNDQLARQFLGAE